MKIEKHWCLPTDAEQNRRQNNILKGVYTPFLQETASSNTMGFWGWIRKAFAMATRCANQIQQNNQHFTCRNSIPSFRCAFKSLAVSNSVSSIKALFFVPGYFPSIPFPCLLSPPFHTCCSACSLVPAAHVLAFSLSFFLSLSSFLSSFLSLSFLFFPCFLSSSPYLTAQLFFQLLWTCQTFLRLRESYAYQFLIRGIKKKRKQRQ